MSDGAPPAGPNDDYALMEAIAARDPSALAALYDRHAPAVLALCVRILKAPADAEDLLLEVFQELWEERRPYDASRGSPRTYLFVLARSRALDRLRARPKHRPAAAAAADAAGDPSAGVSAAPGPLDQAMADEQRSEIREALGRLDARQREAIECAFYEGLSHSDVARRLNRPLGTVKSLIRQGLAQLREALRGPARGSGERR